MGRLLRIGGCLARRTRYAIARRAAGFRDLVLKRVRRRSLGRRGRGRGVRLRRLRLGRGLLLLRCGLLLVRRGLLLLLTLVLRAGPRVWFLLLLSCRMPPPRTKVVASGRKNLIARALAHRPAAFANSTRDGDGRHRDRGTQPRRSRDRTPGDAAAGPPAGRAGRALDGSRSRRARSAGTAHARAPSSSRRRGPRCRSPRPARRASCRLRARLRAAARSRAPAVHARATRSVGRWSTSEISATRTGVNAAAIQCRDPELRGDGCRRGRRDACDRQRPRVQTALLLARLTGGEACERARVA